MPQKNTTPVFSMPPESPPRPPEAVLRSDGARVSKIMPQEGVVVTLGAQARHPVAYRDHLRAPLFTPFLPKSVKNGAKRDYPLFLASKKLASPSLGSPGLEGSSKSNLLPDFSDLGGSKSDFGACARHTPPREVTY